MASRLVIFSGVLGWRLASACVSDEDCNLNGICNPHGKCACVPEWTGETCGVLNLYPARLSPNSGYDEPGSSSWGASIVTDDHGLYHMFVSRFAGHCGLGTWTQNSEIIRATSRDPEGPYMYEETVMPYFAHNPVVRRLPDGTFMMMLIGCGKPFRPFHTGCINGTTKHYEQCINGTMEQDIETLNLGLPLEVRDEAVCDQFNVSVKTAPQLTGPWSNSTQVFLSSGAAVQSWYVDSGRQFSNPAPHIDADGTIRCAYRADAKNSNESFPEYISVAVAKDIFGPYVDEHAAPAVASHRGEDPFMWKDERGHWHLLMHNMGDVGVVGSHAFSRDSVRWTRSDIAPYSWNVTFDDGSTKTMKRRERPHLLLSEQGQPRYFVSGVEDCSDHTYTLVMRVHSDEEAIMT